MQERRPGGPALQRNGGDFRLGGHSSRTWEADGSGADCRRVNGPDSWGVQWPTAGRTAASRPAALVRAESLNESSGGASARRRFFDVLSSTSERLRRRRNSTWDSSGSSSAGTERVPEVCAEPVRRPRASSEVRHTDSRKYSLTQGSGHSADGRQGWAKPQRQYNSAPRRPADRTHPALSSVQFTPLFPLPSRDHDLTQGHPPNDMPGRLSNIPVYQRRPGPAADPCSDPDPDPRPARTRVPRQQTDKSNASGPSTSRFNRSRVDKSQGDSKLLSYTSLPRAKIEYCPEIDANSPRSSFRNKSRPPLDNLTDERCSSPKPPIYSGPKARGGARSVACAKRGAAGGTLRASSPAPRSLDSAASDRPARSVTSERAAGLTVDTGARRTPRALSSGSRTDLRSPRTCATPSPALSAASSRSCPVSPQSSLSPSSPAQTGGTFRFSAGSGIPQRRRAGTDSPASGSSINLSDVSGLSVATSTDRSPPATAAGRHSGSNLPRRAKNQPQQQQQRQQQPGRQPAAPRERQQQRNGSRAASLGSRSTSRTWLNEERLLAGSGCSSPLSRSRESVISGGPGSGRSTPRSPLCDTARPASKTTTVPPPAGPGRKYGTRSIPAVRGRNTNTVSTAADTDGRTESHATSQRKTPARSNGKQADTIRTPVVRDQTDTTKADDNRPENCDQAPAGSKIKVQRSLSLQSPAKPAPPPKPTQLRESAALAACRRGGDDPLTSLPNLQGLGTELGPVATEESRRRCQDRHTARLDALIAGHSRSLSSEPDLNASTGSACSVRQDRYSSRRSSVDASALNQLVSPHKSRWSRDRHVVLQPDEARQGASEWGSMLGDGRCQSGSGEVYIPRTRYTSPAGCGAPSENGSSAASVRLAVSTPPRRDGGLEKPVYSSVIQVNGSEDGVVTNKTRIQRSWEDDGEVQATIQGEKDSENVNKVRLSLNVNGDFLNNQFDAIIETLKQVAASVQEQDTQSERSSVSTGRSNRYSDPIYAEIRSPRPLLSPDEPIYSEIAPAEPVYSTSPSLRPRPAVSPLTQAENDAFFDSSPSLDQLARKLHADARHLSEDCDYVDFHDLHSPYRTPRYTPPSASDVISGSGPRSSDPVNHYDRPPLRRRQEQFGRNSQDQDWNNCRENYGTKGQSRPLSGPQDQQGKTGQNQCDKSTQDQHGRTGRDGYGGKLPDRYRVADQNQFGSLSLGRNLESVQECSENGSRPDSRDGPPSYEKQLQKTAVAAAAAKKLLSRSLSDKGAPTAGSLSVFRTSSGCEEEDGRRFGSCGLDSDAGSGSVFSSASEVWTGRDLETAISSLTAGGSSKSRARSTDSGADPPEAKPKQSGSRLRSLERLVRGGWRSRRSHSSGDDYRDPSFTIDDFIASLYGQQQQEGRDSSGAEAVRARSGRSNSVTTMQAACPGPQTGEHGRQVQEQDGQQSGSESPVQQQRSLSLPKTFLADKYGLAGIKAALPSVLFPWRRGDSNRASGRSSVGEPDHMDDAAVEAPSTAKMAGATEVEESAVEDSDVSSPSRRRQMQVTKSQRQTKASSSPVLSSRRNVAAGNSSSDWDVRRTWSGLYGDQDSEVLSAHSVTSVSPLPNEDDEMTGPRSLQTTIGAPSPTPSSESVLQKFRKSFSLRFYKVRPGAGGGAEAPESAAPSLRRSAQDGWESPPGSTVERQQEPWGGGGSVSPALSRHGSAASASAREDSDTETSNGFRLVPRAWRSSKERRRRVRKEVRSVKCGSADSGDSGIQMEQQAACSPGVRRRARTEDPALTGGAQKRPLSDISGSSIIEEIKAGLQGEVKRRSKAVRRTHSDLGSELVRGCNRQMSQPDPINEHPAPSGSTSLTSDQPTQQQHRLRSGLSRTRGRSRLRRSLSDPNVAPSPARQRRPLLPAAGHITDEDAISESDDELLSDDDHRRRLRDRMFPVVADSVVYAEAHWDYITLDPEELGFKAGDVLEVLDSSDRHWWYGQRGNGQRGWIPSTFVRLRVSQEETVEETLDAIRSGTLRPQLSRKLSVSLLSHDQVRAKVVMEIIDSERAFVQDLVHVIEGYMRQVARRPDLFSRDQMTTLFGNVDELHAFQSEFLRHLESRVDWARPHNSCLGQVFVEFQHGFCIYADYCNNHPSAVSELQALYQNNRYLHFFEACRLLRDMIDISLDGFLLTPIQKICKYPLQLAELLKYTKPTHPDYEPVCAAQSVMKSVAQQVNESKRRMESLEQLAAWQMKVEGWMGPDLLETSTELLHQAEVTKLTSSSWSRELCTLFLFDHLLVYCRRDLLKRSIQQFRGRINLDTAQIVDLPDGKDEFSGVTVKHGIRVHSPLKNKWYIFCCKCEEDKIRWMLKFREERIRVCRDRENGFRVSDKFRRLAQLAARNHLNRPKKPKTVARAPCPARMTLSQAELLINDITDPSQLNKRKGTWFSFGTSKKRSRPVPSITHQYHQLA